MAASAFICETKAANGLWKVLPRGGEPTVLRESRPVLRPTDCHLCSSLLAGDGSPLRTILLGEGVPLDLKRRKLLLQLLRLLLLLRRLCFNSSFVGQRMWAMGLWRCICDALAKQRYDECDGRRDTKGGNERLQHSPQPRAHRLRHHDGRCVSAVLCSSTHTSVTLMTADETERARCVHFLFQIACRYISTTSISISNRSHVRRGDVRDVARKVVDRIP